MPLEGSALEEIVGLTEGYTEDMFGELVEKLGKDANITARHRKGRDRAGKGCECRYFKRCETAEAG